MKVMPTFCGNLPKIITGDKDFLSFFVVAFLLLLKLRVRPQALEDIQNERNGPGDDVGDSCNLIGSQRT